MAADRPLPHLICPRRQPGASAMPAARPPFPVYVLNRIVLVTDKLDRWRGWQEIPCASRRAYGCGDNIQEALEGLVLYKRLGDGPHLNSSLAVRMTEVARRRFESELDPEYYRGRDDELPSNMIAHALVAMAEEPGVTVIALSFTRPTTSDEQPHLIYYLIYDSIDTSLSMFQILPDPCEGAYEGICTLRPIVPKRTDGSDDKLFLLGHEESREDVLWVVSLSSDGGTGMPSKFKSMDFPKGVIDKPFNVDVAFSCQDKAFWGDLKQGLLYCDLHTRDFGFVKLPCKLPCECEGEEFTLPVRNIRTMGCVGDSIRFVCIDMRSHYTNAVVCTWELVLPEEKEKGKGTVKVIGEGAWKESGEKVPARELWDLASFKKAGLPAAPFQYPILTPDGALGFVLVDQSLSPERHPWVDHFCIFDIDRKRLLWHGLVRDYDITDSLVMYPSSSFLQMKQSTSNMSSAEDRPDAGLKAEAGGNDSPAARQWAMAGAVREVVRRFEAMAV